MTSSPTTIVEPKAPAERAAVVMTFDRLLGARLYLHTRIRLCVAALIVIGALIGRYVVDIVDLDVTRLIVLAVFIAGYNCIAWSISRGRRGPDGDERVRRLLRRLMFITILLDYLALTVAVWIVGGARSPFLIFYLLHVILSCVLLSTRMAVFCSALAYVLLAGLVIGEWTGVIPLRTPVAFTDGVALDGHLAITLLVVYAIMHALTAFLLVGLSGLLRQGERELHAANQSLDQLSSVRRDFLQIAVHDVKAPISAVIMMLRNLASGRCGGDLGEEQAHWVNRCLLRLDTLIELLHDLQMMSMVESAEIGEHTQRVDVRAMLNELVAEQHDLAEQHGHDMRLDVPETLPAISGMARLLREAVSNYITNAIKYTPDGGTITVRAAHAPPNVRIEVEDTGIGIAAEDQGRLFDEFVRIKVAGTTVSKATGSGLGLSIVRHVAEKHRGRAGVESAPGRGSTFFLEFPETV
jgi:signal transduction histidine kinase